MCLFCKIINKEIPNYTVYEDDVVLAFLDINPKNPGHTLVIPKKHFEDITKVDNKTLEYMFDIGKKIYDNLKNKLNCNGCSYIINYEACQEIKHIHLHIIPSYDKNINLSVEEVHKKVI